MSGASTRRALGDSVQHNSRLVLTRSPAELAQRKATDGRDYGELGCHSKSIFKPERRQNASTNLALSKTKKDGASSTGVRDGFKPESSALALGKVVHRGSAKSMMPAFDPQKFPHGRVSRTLREYQGDDWLSQTLRMHNLAAVIQAMWRGIQVRTWFRASLAIASRHMKDRERVKRLASIANISRTTALGSASHLLSNDVLANQVRDEEEEEAMEAILRSRRDGTVALDIEELRIMEARFTRLSKEKTYSGQQYQEMTKHVILRGTAKRKLRQHVEHCIVVPPTVTYDPFKAGALISGVCGQKLGVRASQIILAPGACGLPDRKSSPQACFGNPSTKPSSIRPSIRPASVSSSISDWTDCDDEEFPHMMSDVAALARGQYRKSIPKLDAEHIILRLNNLSSQLSPILARYSEPFDPAVQDLDHDIIRDILLHKYVDA